MSRPANPTSIYASAPVRTADVGGWSDTWFAGSGSVCNVAIDHRAEVCVRQPMSALSPDTRVRLTIEMSDEEYDFDPDSPPRRHSIIEHAISSIRVPGDVHIVIADSVVAGSGLGTSAAVMVALVAALTAARGDVVEPGAVARLAHRFETSTGKQSGVQDHWAAAFGGINMLRVEYPAVERTEVMVPVDALADLSSRLHTVYFGHPHTSSRMHDEVIARLESEGAPIAFARLRAAAGAAADALMSGRVDAYGRALIDGHEAVRLLHADLLSDDAHELAELAASCGARGWKSNGAGGSGGSMVVLGPADRGSDAALLDALDRRTGWRLIEGSIAARGVEVVRRADGARG